MNMAYNDDAPSSLLDIQPVTLAGMRFIMSFYGMSESGKTLSALKVAAGMEPDPKKRALLDTEGGQRGRMYMHDIPGGYLYAQLTPPYTPERYTKAIDEFAAKGVTVLVTDSASHAWFAEGGVLEMVENSTSKNDMAKWKDPKRRLGKMLGRYRSSDMHHILCSRAKQPLIKNPENPKELILGPIVAIQDKSLKFDMTIVALFLGRGKYSIAWPEGKCPGPLQPVFAGHELMDEEIGRKLIAWIGANGSKSPEHRALESDATDAANEGTEALRRFWDALTPQQKGLLAPTKGNLKSIASAADTEAARVKAEAEAEKAGDGQTATTAAEKKPDDPFASQADRSAEVTVERVPIFPLDGGGSDWKSFHADALTAIATLTPEQVPAWLELHNAAIKNCGVAKKAWEAEIRNALDDRASAQA